MGERRSENLEEMGNKRNIYCCANRGVVNLEENTILWYQNLCVPSLSYIQDQFFFLGGGGGGDEKTQLSAQNLTSLYSQYIIGYIKTLDETSYVIS